MASKQLGQFGVLPRAYPSAHLYCISALLWR